MSATEESREMSAAEETRRLLHEQTLSGTVQQHIYEVIHVAAKTVQLLKPGATISGMRENQLRNVVNAALEASSIEEVAAFIMFQLGRSTNRGPWSYNGFGEAVIADLTGPVRTIAQHARDRAVEALAQTTPNDLPSDPERQRLLAVASMALARQYLGYLNRLFYYADRANGWDRLPKLVAQQEAQNA